MSIAASTLVADDPERRWLVSFLRSFALANVVVAVIPAMQYGQGTSIGPLLINVIVLLTTIALVWAQRQVSAGRGEIAGVGIFATLALDGMVAVLLIPEVLPSALLLVPSAVAVSLPYLRAATLYRLLPLAWASVVIMAVAAVQLRLLPPQPWVLGFPMIVSMAHSAGIGLLALGRYHARLTELIDQQRATNALLQQSKAGLEQKVAARTAQVEWLVSYDALTGLANRQYLMERTTLALEAARPLGEPLAVLCLDLDRFKTINDTIGHDVGDELLTQVAERLATCIRSGDTLARLGGDEFAVLLPGADKPAAASTAERILAHFEEPFAIQDHVIHVRASIGAASYPSDGDDVLALMRHADIAMYRAKARGTRYQGYTPTLRPFPSETVRIEAELRRAVAADELTLHYQPVLDLHTGVVARVEALVRWHHPLRGLVPPGEFIPIAEECGAIRAIDHWVLRAALRQAACWEAAGLDVPVSVNMSVLSLQEPQLVEEVRIQLAAAHLSPGRITVEVTETAAMRDPELTQRVLRGLRDLGLSIALDDLGSGYASLTSLKSLPVDIMKVDRAFVGGIGRDPRDEALLRAIGAVGRVLGIQVIAEGVEEEAQLVWLREAGYDQAQGYLIGRPSPPEQIAFEPCLAA